mmetsp:Transcript_34967/g.39660  ORF Transcript_34967/g.39660 Transcript_34967/m.39660 type:complete len:222 (+) Transcript_34967:91-756(+)
MRAFRRPLFNTFQTSHWTRGLQEFSASGKQATGRSWKPDELRLKSNEDLQKLWYVLLKEKNFLLSEKNHYRQLAGGENLKLPILERVRLSMDRIKAVIQERSQLRENYRRELEEAYILTKKKQLGLVDENGKKIFKRYPQPNLDHVVINEQEQFGKRPSQREIMLKYVKNWYRLNRKQRNSVLGMLNAQRSNEAKEVFIKELHMIGQRLKERQQKESPDGN